METVWFCNTFIILPQIGYWQPGFEPELECKENLYITANATFEAGIGIYKATVTRYLRIG